MANINITSAQRIKTRALKPIIDSWNKVHEDCWKISRPGYECDTIILHRAKPYQGFYDNIHGCLVTDIAGICNAYSWSWAVYNDKDYNGINVNI